MQLDVMKLLLRKGANTNISDLQQQTALDHATTYNYCNAISTLLKGGAIGRKSHSKAVEMIYMRNRSLVQR